MTGVVVIIKDGVVQYYTEEAEKVNELLETALGKKEDEQQEQPRYPDFLWPTEYPGVVTQAFGINPQWYRQWGVPAHEGIDMKAPMRSKVYAVWDGVVSRVGFHTAYGNHIRLKHVINGIEYESTYAHFVEPAHHKVGDRLTRGVVLGIADSTGNSTGSHLHFHLKQFNGEKPDTEAQKKYNWPYNLIDPTPFFKELR